MSELDPVGDRDHHALEADSHAAKPTPGGALRRLWGDQLPLGTAFWWWAIVWGTGLNVAATLLAMALLAADLSAALAVAVAALPIPYNLVVLVAVWRSAGAYHGPRLWADLARIVSLIWALAASAA
jgi:hypothetical protein